MVKAPQQDTETLRRLLRAGRQLRRALASLSFAAPVSYVYNPLDYAWPAYERYLRAYANNPKRVLFLGINPGPFGMVQTGVPFGEVAAVRNWLGIETAIGRPKREHPKRPVTGFACARSEVSGQRLWGLFAARFGTPQRFFSEHVVINYCPLAFVEATGRNRTPDKLRPSERETLFALCDEHLEAAAKALQPEWIIGIGDFAFTRASVALAERGCRISRILHPSPASPASNRNWAETAAGQLRNLGVWL